MLKAKTAFPLVVGSPRPCRLQTTRIALSNRSEATEHSPSERSVETHRTVMRIRRSSSSLLPFLFLLLFLFAAATNGVEGGKSRVHIPDELEDVIDDEEDEAWKEWGKKSKNPEGEFDPPPPFHLYETDPSAFQADMMKRHTGPSMGFVKLQPGITRSAEMVAEIAMKWTRVLKTGSINAKFMGFDLNTVMFTMERGQDVAELKEFVLSQPDAYEMKIGDQIFRRPGDPPLDEVMQKLHSERKAVDQSSKEESEHLKDEL